MIRKPSQVAHLALALLCAAIFAACNSTVTLQDLTVAPSDGTIYISGGSNAGVKAARRGVRHAAARPVTQGKRKSAVSPKDITTAVCGSLQYSATGYYSNGTTQDQSSAVTWSSSNTSVAAVDNTGFVSGVGIGFSNIGASLNGVAATAVPVEVDLLTSIDVAPANPSIAMGASEQFAATGNFTLAADGSSFSQDISSQVSWVSSDEEVATVDATGNATSVGEGTATISAISCDGNTIGSTRLTVGPAQVVSLKIIPADSTASVGSTVQFTAVEVLSDTNTQPPQHPVTWSSDATETAIIDPNTALAQAVAIGTANITATEAVSGLTDTTGLTVQAATARFAYVGNINGGAGGGGTISSYTVDATSTTPVTPLATTAAATPTQVLLHPSGDLLYYINTNGSLFSDFVDSTSGALTATKNDPVPATDSPTNDLYAGVIDATGRFLYVITSETSNSSPHPGASVIYGFKITHTQPSGGTNDAKLTPITGMTAYNDATLDYSSWIMTDKAGKYVYVINEGDDVNPGSVSEYSIDQTTGKLTQLASPNASIPTGVSPLFGTISANGHLYVANQGSTLSSISGYSIASDGHLTSVGADTQITGASDLVNVITDPTSSYLYILDFGDGSSAGQVFTYGLNTSTGVIGSAIGSAQPTDLAPTGMAVDPTGALLAIDNFDANVLSLFTIGSDGSVTPATPATVPTDTTPEFVVFYTAAAGQ